MPENQFAGLKAVFINCTLKPTKQGPSHTERLMRDSISIMQKNGVSVDYLRAADHRIAFGVQPDMRETGTAVDDWPEIIWPKVRDAHILVLGTPIWLGEESSLCRVIIERLYAHSGQTQENGQYVFYGKAGGCIVTGNEDGLKHVSMTCLYALQHVGYTIPPQSEAGWVGDAGPGPSYGDELDDGSHAGLDNDFTRQKLTFMTWNLMNMGRIFADSGGFPLRGNSLTRWKQGERFDHPCAKS
ncbi:MAG TPA: NAD(P)H-dependent oxidoreductase [Aurantimonas sp.]|nr:NAD(P)H-dependent oxidoreductase [Aurantimonas sp.]